MVPAMKRMFGQCSEDDDDCSKVAVLHICTLIMGGL